MRDGPPGCERGWVDEACTVFNLFTVLCAAWLSFVDLLVAGCEHDVPLLTSERPSKVCNAHHQTVLPARQLCGVWWLI